MLIILPSLRAWESPSGIRLTKKFMEGVEIYARQWPGKVRVLFHPDTNEHSNNLDDVIVDPRSLGFEVRVVRYDSQEMLSELLQASVVQGGSDHLQSHVPEFCHRHGIAFTYVSEYTLRTRLQIAGAEVKNPIRRLRRFIWEYGQERRNQRGVRLASAVQCNGTPTYDAYAKINPNALLYFDTRLSEDMIALAPRITPDTRFNAARPLRLAFSGRLDPMKGADDLIRVAKQLEALEVPFTMDICGDGSLVPQMRAMIERWGLSEIVRMRGVLDFKDELIPFLKQEIDLFVCCHRQGDPSCTYAETLACGIPIVGYDNEAFRGIVSRAKVGWLTPMNKPHALAQRIVSLQPEQLAAAAKEAIAFARNHTFERTARARIEHMLQVKSNGRLAPALGARV